MDGGERKLPTIVVDGETETLEYNGVRMSFDLLDTFTTPSQPGAWFRIIKVEGGKSTVQTWWPERDKQP